MAKDIIIGGASNYSWDQLKYWVNSIAKSGFTGDVVLVATNISKETIDKLTQRGVKLALYGDKEKDGGFKAHSNGAPHTERFFYMWNTLCELNPRDYRYVITTDTRDVIFQTNPSDWLEKNLSNRKIVCSSEGLKYKDEPWGNKNLLETFGPYFHNILKENLIYNVGTIGGDFSYIRDLLLMIFQMSVNRPIPIVDQAVFNFLINQYPYCDDKIIHKTTNFSGYPRGWAIQLGTTEQAILAGHGDIGQIVSNDPTQLVLYKLAYQDEQPTIREDGVVADPNNKPFTIVHQYDRIPELKKKIEALYAN